MLSWAITFLIIAIVAAVLGFGGIAGKLNAPYKHCWLQKNRCFMSAVGRLTLSVTLKFWSWPRN